MVSLMAYAWPGNIRELRNIVERSIARAWDGEEPLEIISFDPFDSPWRPEVKNNTISEMPETEVNSHSESLLQNFNKPFNIKEIITENERKLLLGALEHNRHNQRATANYVGLSYDQLRHALKKYELV